MNKQDYNWYVKVSMKDDVFFDPISCEFLQKLSPKKHENMDLKRKVRGLSLVLGYDCNMRCIYCYANGGYRKDSMKFEIAKGAIMAVKKLFSDSDIIRITFTGGEPTIYYDLMEKIVKFANDYLNAETIYLLNTNGVFSEKILQLLLNRQYRFFVQLSYDGSEVQDIQRPLLNFKPSRDIVLKNMKILIKNKIPLLVRVTVTKNNVKNLPDIVEQLATIGVKFIRIERVNEWGRASGKNLVPDTTTFIDSFLNATKKGMDMNITVLNGALMNICTPSDRLCAAMNKKEIIVLPDGVLSACYAITDIAHPLAKWFSYGRVNENNNEFIFDEAKVKKLQSYSVEKLTKCYSCEIKYVCSGGCPVLHYTFIDKKIQFRFWDVSDSYCRYAKQLILGYLRTVYLKTQKVDK